MVLNTVEELIEDIRQGKMVILMDDEDRENEGDLVMAAPMVRPEDINFMATNARGLICLTLNEQRCHQLDLAMMVSGENNNSSHSTPFTLSIEAAEGVTTGISAADRARTVQAAVASNARPDDIVQPGHIFPLKAQEGGVLSRAGHTEAGCDLAKMAGFEPAAVIVEIMNEDGTMARRDDLEKFAQKHDLKIGTIADLIHYRLVTEKTTRCINERKVNTHFGDFILKTYLDSARNEKHFALVMGDLSGDQPPLVRVHVNRLARDILAVESLGEYKAWSFYRALERVAKEGRGAVILLYYPETAGDIDAEVEAILNPGESRAGPASDVVYQQVGTGSQILMDLGVQKMRLMSAPFKFTAISGFDLEVVEYVSCD
ncbi:bifunctional 3,4-dihydroxy-2-butanone-4-phosphate synthase/GTP cyclohydrolase II [Porticoccaceae bacterium]|jgi:3,4-dihydroxy 2-butanone 4-phosphate synthase/GTP cyclohydrolase II|nr:bifunctional 3,4-dihydroxy-2-butanone-4-phosphate synthase/GTP cyclohydrolase II [Porticoccaceae bacterium]MDA8651920.1 bifunctional 3,4-dihydroxy-2-butanone-4-phosphate synthase/GTP cyclohydrolase II [Porticoccaceae bacterium]MDB2633943.1 bifunctional 3,4-dihydroxy-2-butanone-4-phosphate synthase/GTP cyclohydrolase II [Porticoccaceae bacterium]MDB2664956.1 bifunctional 3,4-dihydroxy-2-butanone-4-phosphate synthase/GTP cyclohydrolase II [Porticoccaceae bacterium]